MFALIVAATIAAAGGSESARSAFTMCLRSAVTKGTEAKVEPAGFAAFARQTCANEVGAFRTWVIAYDMKAGWTRKKAEPDADAQAADYLDEATDQYKSKATAAK